MARLQQLDDLARIFSFLTLLWLALSVVGRRTGIVFQPEWLETRLLPVLTAAAVGYLTNYLAIWLLFKPYAPHRILGWKFQGVIPRRREAFGAALGERIPQYLLKPEELSAELSELFQETLRNRDLLADLRDRAGRLLGRYREQAVGFLLPQLEPALLQATRASFTSDNLGRFYDRVIGGWLQSEANQDKLTAGLIGVLQQRTPELTRLLRGELREAARNYVQTAHPTLSRWLSADEFAGRLVDSLNWDLIRTQLESRLEEPSFRALIGGEVLRLVQQAGAYFHSAAAERELRSFLDQAAGEMEEFLRLKLRRELPELIGQLLTREEFWRALEEQLLPLLQSYLDHYLRREGREAILRRLDLSGRIERSVAALEMRELHQLLNQISGEQLVAIQLLGFLLGGAAGILLSFLN